MTLFCMNIPVQIAFMVFIRTMNLGDTSIEGNAFLIGYFLVACTTAGLVLIITKVITWRLFRMGYDPDNYALPYLYPFFI